MSNRSRRIVLLALTVFTLQALLLMASCQPEPLPMGAMRTALR